MARRLIGRCPLCGTKPRFESAEAMDGLFWRFACHDDTLAMFSTKSKSSALIAQRQLVLKAERRKREENV